LEVECPIYLKLLAVHYDQMDITERSLLESELTHLIAIELIEERPYRNMSDEDVRALAERTPGTAPEEDAHGEVARRVLENRRHAGLVVE